MVRVWRNECLRVFHDRLINETDKELVSTLKMYQQMQKTNKQKTPRTQNKQKAKLQQQNLSLGEMKKYKTKTQFFFSVFFYMGFYRKIETNSGSQ